MQNPGNIRLWGYAAAAALVCVSMGWAQRVPVYYDSFESGKLTGGRFWLDGANPVHRAAFGLDAPERAGTVWPVTVIENNGPAGNRIDLVLLGDGYTAGELGAYAVHANGVRNGIFAQEPLAAYRSFFNVHRVDVASNESGVDELDLGIFKDTALDMAFGCAGIDRLLCINVSKALEAAASAADVDQILALANSTRYGGAGYGSYDLCTLAGNNSAAIELALHEFGHSFAELADEYHYGDGSTYSGPEPVEANVSKDAAAAQAALQTKWWRWLDLAAVDTFEGAYYNQFGVYRPTFDSKMRSLYRPFEQINVEQFVVTMYKVVSPIDDATPASASPLPACGPFFVDPVDPLDHALSVQWSVDGVPVAGAVGTLFTPDVSALGGGLHQLSVTVVDTTTRVRDESLRAAWLTEVRQWTILAPAPYGDVDESGSVDVGDILCVVAGFEVVADCPRADIDPCGGNGEIDVGDVLAVLDAFGGNPPCPVSCG
jgi:hypothetical protein